MDCANYELSIKKNWRILNIRKICL
jgi:hypothetical protein